MKYTEKDIKVGTKLRCTKAKPSWWTVGKIYEVSLRNDGVLQIIDDYNHSATQDYIIDCLNGEHQPVKFELIKKEENKMQKFKVGDLVEVISNTSWAVNEIGEPYKKGDLAIITNVYSTTVRLGNNPYANLIKKTEIKKVESTPELTEYEEELVIRLAESINRKDNYLTELENLKYKLNEMENNYEKVSKEIKEISKKLLTK